MTEVIKMPRLSDTMTEGVVVAWLKKVGDKIEEGDILAEIETDKATMEFESFNEGTLLYIGLQEGETAPVDSLLAIIGDEGEDVSKLIAEFSDSSVSENEVETTEVVEETSTKKIESTAIPEGIEIIRMPRLSDTMTEGTVAAWLKKVGDKIEEGDILAEIETDKATMEFESFNEGTLLYIGLQEGETAVVDSLLAIIGKEGTNVEGIVSSFEMSSSPTKSETPTPVKKTPKSIENKIASPAKAEVSMPIAKSSDECIIASPLAKKLAEDKGIKLSQIQGTGDHGRIIKRDVENYVPAVANASGSVAKFVANGQEDFDEVKNSQMRKAIARSLTNSKFTAPHYYLNVEFDMDNAMAFRTQFNSVPDTKISFNDMIVKACALALRQHPQVNSQWFDDRMQLNNHVHIGVAVGIDDGLVVPVVRFANEQSLPQIGAAVRDYAKRARIKKLTPEEMQGSTFTISNLGMFGIESFTSIINQPNSAILSVGAIVQKPVVKNGQIVAGNTMKLCLACDHRTVDGVTGSLFLQTLQGFIENPITMLM